MVFGSNPANLVGRGGDDEDLAFSQETSISGQVAQQWILRVTAQEPVLKEMANDTLRRRLAHNRSFNCTDANVGDSVLYFKAANRKSAPRLRSPAAILEID